MLTAQQITDYLAAMKKAGLRIVRATIEDDGKRLVVETTTPPFADNVGFVSQPPYNHPGDDFDTVDFTLGQR